MTDNQDYFKKFLRENGLKVTNQRIAILEVFRDCPGCHLTAEELYDHVKREHPEIGLATVYRTVQKLSELGLIDKINLDDGYVRYEISMMEGETCHHHHHLICLNCGEVFAFAGDMLDSLEEHITHSMGFQVVDHEVKLFGYCKACRKEITK